MWYRFIMMIKGRRLIFQDHCYLNHTESTNSWRNTSAKFARQFEDHGSREVNFKILWTVTKHCQKFWLILTHVLICSKKKWEVVAYLLLSSIHEARARNLEIEASSTIAMEEDFALSTNNRNKDYKQRGYCRIIKIWFVFFFKFDKTSSKLDPSSLEERDASCP